MSDTDSGRHHLDTVDDRSPSDGTQNANTAVTDSGTTPRTEHVNPQGSPSPMHSIGPAPVVDGGSTVSRSVPAAPTTRDRFDRSFLEFTKATQANTVVFDTETGLEGSVPNRDMESSNDSATHESSRREAASQGAIQESSMDVSTNGPNHNDTNEQSTEDTNGTRNGLSRQDTNEQSTERAESTTNGPSRQDTNEKSTERIEGTRNGPSREPNEQGTERTEGTTNGPSRATIESSHGATIESSHGATNAPSNDGAANEPCRRDTIEPSLGATIELSTEGGTHAPSHGDTNAPSGAHESRNDTTETNETDESDESDFYKRAQGGRPRIQLLLGDKDDLLALSLVSDAAVDLDSKADTVSVVVSPEPSIETNTFVESTSAHATEWQDFAEARIVPHTGTDACVPLPLQRVQAETPVSERVTTEGPLGNSDPSPEESPGNENPMLPPNNVSPRKRVKGTIASGTDGRKGMYCRIAALGIALLVASVSIGLLWRWANVNDTSTSETQRADNRTGTTSPAPTPVPSFRDQVIAYIRNVTLTGQQFLHVTSFEDETTLEERALKLLLEKGIFQDYPDTPYHQFRWRQRYALATMLLQLGKAGEIERIEHECDWWGVDCEKVYLDGIDESVKAVTEISIGYQYKYGSIPADIGLLTNVEHLDLSSNLFGGTLPSSLQYLTSMKHFTAYATDFNGTLPECVRYWTSLEQFSVHGNDITGTLPDFLGNLTSLQVFSMGDNDLSGTLPSSIVKWTNLVQFSVWNNALSGTFPRGIGSWTNLLHFDGAENEFQGTLPDSFGNWTNLETFDVSSNSIVGAIPSSFRQWSSSLELFRVTENELTGTLPEFIGHWSSLLNLSAHDNNLNGTIPESIGLCSRLNRLHLSNNRLTGPLPVSIERLTALEYFDVSNNALTGSLTESFTNWTSIQHAYFYWNNFTGVPGNICLAPDLVSLRADCHAEECPCCDYCY